ncbi:MAG: glutamate--tRNA ligase [Acidobacteria bacterium]|nr:MAG: glutamate--tRNA ligase [Acidobacteriota bacterium]
MKRVRTRIAPSPTGAPHVGTAYTALFNYCLAKSLGGDFILRIEDTDQNRSRPEYEKAILDALEWTGLTWDEGPDKGGEFGPYRQSERTEIYTKHAQELLDKGHAYKCFCTADRLNRVRGERLKEGHSTLYDAHCRSLSKEEIHELEAQGTPYTVRLNVPEEGSCVIQDPLRGEVRFEYKTIDHQILMKSDGFPTYHLANVVDDHLMGISHVLRGEEWLPSLPKHILLYDYFGWEKPVFYHLPLLRNADKSKLSKRKNPTSILYYKEIGMLPQTLLNFLGLLVYSYPGDTEKFTLQQMVESFDVQRVNLSGPVFDLDKMTWLNQQYLVEMESEQLVQELVDWRFNREFLLKLLPMMKKRLHKLGDFFTACDFMFFSDLEYEKERLLPKGKTAEETRDILQMFIWELEKLTSFQRDDVYRACQAIAEMRGWSLREITHAVRVAVCGKTVAPPLFDSMEIVGSDVCRNRLMNAVNELGPLGKKKLNKLQKAYQAAGKAETT